MFFDRGTALEGVWSVRRKLPFEIDWQLWAVVFSFNIVC